MIVPAIALLATVVGGCGIVRWGMSKANKSAALTTPSTKMTGAEVAQLLLEEGGPKGGQVIEFDAAVSNRYDPVRNRVLLTTDVFHGRGAEAWGIAAHETGHALQQNGRAKGWRMRLAVIKLGALAGGLSPFVLLGLCILRGFPPRLGVLIVLAIWVLVGIAHVCTIATEFNATTRAIDLLQRCGHLRREEDEDAVRTAAAAAAWRELGDIPKSPLLFLYHLLPLLGRPKE